MNDFGNTWSTAEETVLREGYGRVHAEELGKKLGRSVQAVMHRANRIGLQSRRRWTPSDDQELRALWGECSLPTLAKRIKRTPATTYWRARMLGLPLGCPQGREYLTAAAERTGYDTKSLRFILKTHGVRIMPSLARPTGAKRHFHVVDPQDVDDAIAEHLKGAPVQQHAKDYGVSGECVRFWLLRARAAGFDIPAPPEQARCYWHVRTETVAKVMAWRDSQETVMGGAKRVGLHRETLHRLLLAAGFVKPPGKTWWVFKADVDRVVGGRK